MLCSCMPKPVFPVWKNQWNNDVWMVHVSERSAGILTLKNFFAGDVLHHFSDPSGHFLLMVICLNNTVVILINIYGYNSSHENDLLLEVIEEKILLWLNANPNAFVFIGGDFNIVPDNNFDRLPPK